MKDIKIKKKKKQQYGCEHYKNLWEEEKQKLAEYRKAYYRLRTNTLKRWLKWKKSRKL